MRVLVWGLGYVGTVTAACLAEMGHDVVGVDLDTAKVAAIKEGRCAFHEPGLDEIVARMVKAGRLRAVQKGESLIESADISLICVGTPNDSEGRRITDSVEMVAESIGRGLRLATNFHVVVMRSTVFPGTTRLLLRGLLERSSGKEAGVDFGLAANPEFLREVSAVADFYNPPYIVIGELEPRSGERLRILYNKLDAPLYLLSLEEAEMVKLVNNAFHSLKIGFANEIGRLSDPLGINSHTVMEIVCADTKLNISPMYLRPGFSFGGSCLPKDLRTLIYGANTLDVAVPILENILPSNHIPIEMTRRNLRERNLSRVGVLGMSYKPGSDDLRESPALDLICGLVEDGLDVRVYDPDIQLSTLSATNRATLQKRLPDFEQILCSDIYAVMRHSEAIAVCQKRQEFVAARQFWESCYGEATILDLARIGEKAALNGLFPRLSIEER